MEGRRCSWMKKDWQTEEKLTTFRWHAEGNFPGLKLGLCHIHIWRDFFAQKTKKSKSLSYFWLKNSIFSSIEKLCHERGKKLNIFLRESISGLRCKLFIGAVKMRILKTPSCHLVRNCFRQRGRPVSGKRFFLHFFEQQKQKALLWTLQSKIGIGKQNNWVNSATNGKKHSLEIPFKISTEMLQISRDVLVGKPRWTNMYICMYMWEPLSDKHWNIWSTRKSLQICFYKITT
jgi:hypothetical protein